MDNTLEKIHKATLNFLEPLTAEETWKKIVDEAMKLVGAEFGSIFLEESGELKRVYASSYEMYKTIVRKRGFTYKAFKKRKAFVVGVERVSKIHPNVKKMGVKSTIFIPLSYRNKSIGVLSVDSFENQRFTDKELDILNLYGSLASLAIRKVQLYDELVQSLESRDLFISMAAHELRTPLTTISGYVQLLKQKFKDKSLSEARWIEELSWETMRMTQLINELLAVNKINRGELTYSFKEKSIREIVARAVNNFKFAHPDHQIELKDRVGRGKDQIICDFDKMLQAVDNVLDNAAKFSPVNSKTIISLEFKKPCWVLQIKDNGRGIGKDELPKIFENYYRGAGHSHEGMGVGLYLAKNIIEKHHGEIEIRSKEKQGTNVTIKLPTVKT